MARATCLHPGCTWAAEGDPDTVDKAAEKHTKAGHATSTREVGKVKPYYEDDAVTLWHGDAMSVLPTLGQFDAAVVDPPYGETSLDWDRWPDGWPALVAQHTSSMWCFGSLRMFLTHRDEFTEWRLSQDVIWEKHNGATFHADRFARVHETITHWYRGPWSDAHQSVPVTMDATKRALRRKGRPVHTGHIEDSAYVSEGRRPTAHAVGDSRGVGSRSRRMGRAASRLVDTLFGGVA